MENFSIFNSKSFVFKMEKFYMARNLEFMIIIFEILEILEQNNIDLPNDGIYEAIFKE